MRPYKTLLNVQVKPKLNILFYSAPQRLYCANLNYKNLHCEDIVCNIPQICLAVEYFAIGTIAPENTLWENLFKYISLTSDLQ